MKRSGAWRYVAAVGIVLVSALFSELLYRLLNTTRLSMVFLAGVVVAAVTLGARPAYLAAGLAFVIYDFYLAEPRFVLQFSSAEDVIVLVVFLLVAVLTGGLAGRARDEGLKAKAQAANTQTLYEASRELSSTWDETTIRDHLADRIAIAIRGPACVLDDAGHILASVGDPPPEQIRQGLQARTAETEAAATRHDGWRHRPLREDAPDLGAAAWRPPVGVGDDEAGRVANILVDLGAAAIIRARLGARQSELEAHTRTEQLRNALLSSISHDFRTPLAAILASATSLRELFDELDRTSRDDFLATIEEEAERLNRFVANLLHMSKLESGVVKPHQSVVEAAEILNRIAERHDRGRDEGRVRVEISPGDLLMEGDAILLEYALENVVENALRFSSSDSPVTLTGARRDGMISLEVVDEGPGVEPKDLERIFEKFFQAEPSRPEAPGAGLGLSIARGLVEAMDGALFARNRSGRSGLHVTAVLPAAP